MVSPLSSKNSPKKVSENLQATQQAKEAKRLAVVFPGQGSQSVGMLKELAEEYPVVEQTFDEASSALGFDLWEVCQDEEKLALTEYTQPAILTSSIAIWRILQDQVFNNTQLQQASLQDDLPADDIPSATPTAGVPPIIYMAGHSLGEYSALCAANVMSLKDAVKLVHKRGQYMQQAVEGLEIQMAAILGLESSQVISICKQVSETTDDAVVSAANFNSPNQVVIAGNTIGVDMVSKQVKMLGKKIIPLKVSVPSHCALMRPACQELSEILKRTQFSLPDTPVIQNQHAHTESDINNIKTALTQQLCLPVLWSQTMQVMADKHINMIIECGPGNVLSNLAKRQATPITSYPTDKPTRLNKLLEALV